MAEEIARSKQYEYRATSNLVLEADREGRSRSEAGMGEVETLNGRLNTVRMGDKLSGKTGTTNKNTELTDRIEKARVKRDREEHNLENSHSKKKKDSKVFVSGKGSNVLTATEDMDSINYRPKTRESKAAYEEILSFVQSSLGDQPNDILRGAADEILAILKDESLRDPDRMKDIGKILLNLTTDKFHKVVAMGKRINDFHQGLDGATDDDASSGMDEDMGVAVIFEDEDEDEDNENDAELDEENDRDRDDDYDDDDEGVEAEGSGNMLRGGDVDDGDNADDSAGNVSVHTIDAHWLQRQLSKYYMDATVSSRLAEETLQALQLSDERACENRLVVLLDFDKFEFIKLLLRNRAKIYYCTRLKQAQTETERKSIEQEMETDAVNGGPSILAALKQTSSAESWTQDRIGEMTNKARREARALSKSGSTANDGNMDVIDESAINISAGSDVVNITGQEMFIDLEGLQFNQGSHFMANKRCELPEKSWRAQKKGYEEVHVPAIKPIIPPGEKLVDIEELPSWAQPAFNGIRALNRIQSKMVQAALYGSDNILLCAPTGAGKTNVALLCMLNQIGQHLRDDGSFNLDAFKIVYVAPMKALVQECVLSFGKRLAPFGINVRELSGDQNLSRQQIQDTQVIVTTPEKWDIITRKSGDRTYTQLVRLMIIDEIHLLHDDRGPVLEALVARTIRQIESTREMVRLVGLSATLPNFEDVAAFLRVYPDKGLFFFDHSYRPVPLQQQYIGVTEKKALKRFQLMNEICYEKVLQQAGRNQVLIFTHSRAETAKTARALRDLAQENDTLNHFVREESASKEILRVESDSVKNSDLKDLLPFGFAIHHAGMVRSDRTLVEDLFADRHVQVLVSTATLAWGVNLPCHTVIIKGTQMYNPEQSRWIELSPLDIMQMMGRAGRYGLDSEGEGIIMTTHSELQYYLSLMNQQLPIESQMIKKLPDSLNAEIVLGNVLSVKEAAKWLGYTYLYVRMLKNPALYGIVPEDHQDLESALLQRRLDLAHTAAAILDEHGLIKYDRKSGNFQATTLGRIASHYYVSHDSIKVFNEFLKPGMSEIEIFRLFSLSGEFKHIFVRDEEKLELTKLINRVPIPVKEGVEEPSAKVNILLQAYISRLKLDGFALAADMTFIQQSASRLMRALFEIALKRNWAALAVKALTVCKMVEKRTWGCQSPLRQFPAIPEVIIRKLEKNSDLNWDRYFDLKPADLGEIVKIPKMGKTLYKFVHMFPKLVLSASVQPVTRSLLRIDLTIMADFEFDASVHEGGILFWILVEDMDGEKILHYEPFMLKARSANFEHSINLAVALQDPMPPQYFVRVVSDRWLHSEAILPISFRHLLLPQKFPPPTELLDLQPLPVIALGNKHFEQMFPDFRRFNPIQTQTFSALYQTDDSVLVCAPTGCGKTVCAEFALFQQFAANRAAKCAYIAPREEIAESMYKHWKNRFEVGLGWVVVKLTGETASDLLLIERANIIISTALNWDSISRRWKQRKNIQDVSLYIADELHLIGGADGPTMEVVLSRARYIASQLERKIRIVGLASSLANAKDVSDWLGASSNNVFNFAPDVRSIPVDIHIFGFEAAHFATRLLSMAKPTFNAIVSHGGNKPALVFVPSRKQAQLTAIDMVTMVMASPNPNRFLLSSSKNSSVRLESFAEEISDSVLAQSLAVGVGYLHPGLPRKDKEIVERLYAQGSLGVLVCPHTMCWSVPAPAHLVVIMDTVSYDGRDHRYVDYPIYDVLQMIGLASRPLLDESGVAVVLCQTPKKDYLKRLLHDPLPVESHLDQFLHDHICAEVVTKTIENKQDAVDYLTWTLYYRRLTQNPNYYNVQGVTHRHMSDHLSELVENIISDLETSKCLSVEDEFELSALNLGMIASYYYIQYTTIELFASSLTAKTKVKGLLEILSAATEYSNVTIRYGEERALESMSKHLPFGLPAEAKFDDSSTKVLILLQAYLSRVPLNSELSNDLNICLNEVTKLIQAIVDVISSNGWLKPALLAMELSQMVVQGQWNKDPVLFQLPHFTQEIVSRCQAHEPPVETVFDVLDLDDDVRDSLLQLSPEKMSDVAVFCNAYPNVDLSYKVSSNEVLFNVRFFEKRGLI
jgi:pre-mRNA-splicing helicase BRR2